MYQLCDLNQMLNDCKQELISLGYNEVQDKYYSVSINPRFRHKLGCCSLDKKTLFYKIQISKVFMEICPDKIKNTMMHELIHSVNGCMNHGPNFQHLAALVNRKFGYNVKTHSDVPEYSKYLNETKHYRYKLMCNTCRKEWLYEKAGKLVRGVLKNPNYCKCPHCRGNSFSVINL